MNRTHLRRGIAALFAASLIVAGCSDDDTDTDAGSTTTADPGGDGHDHEDLDGREVGDWDVVPTVALEATPDGDNAVALDVTTTGLNFGPDVDQGADHVEGEGHVHVYVDGIKITRIFANEYRIEELTPGEHEITVGVNGNDHRPWLVDGEPIEASQTVVVTGEDAVSDDSDLVIDVTVAGGEVSGGGRHDVSVGDTVTLVVTSDVADHVHLHGYDVMVDVTPGEPAELTFDATISGVFEVELEDSGLPLLELEIS